MNECDGERLMAQNCGSVCASLSPPAVDQGQVQIQIQSDGGGHFDSIWFGFGLNLSETIIQFSMGLPLQFWVSFLDLEYAKMSKAMGCGGLY